ncbi:dihydroorotase [Halarchaeum nitratireducens]|uniref:Dihydropyrimidinase n=1 Tax=Halarchaeum nitratireducens TaxID=489913 RepID=A0A830GDE0_9EURY|nr:amidohydrolase family protein [Halarchaeum nitratireducens]GGN20947.1 dihydropyrimidinase [Halarchaeum nitratireducens]
MSVDLTVVGGTLATVDGLREAGFAVDDGTIVAVGDPDRLPAAERTLDVDGRLVMPGVVDPHVHVDGFNSIDSYETGTAAAARGGVTTVINFAWQTWTGEREYGADGSVWADEGSLLDAIERQKRKAGGAYVDYGLHATVTAEDESVFEEFDALIEAGVPTVKFFTAYDIGVSNGFLRLAFEELADRDAVAVLHTEDAAVCEALREERRREGRGDPVDYPGARPDYAEAMALADAVTLADATGCKYYGIHTSSRAAAAELAAVREDGSQFRGETCTHYATLTEDAYAERGTLALQSPPLRRADDVDAMFEYLREGTLDVVSTDHVASTREEKTVDDWWECSFGVNGLQASLPVFHDEAVNERGHSYGFLVRAMCAKPAATFGLPKKGRLAVGADADFVVFDPDESYTITAEENASKADYSIYEGREVTGRVTATYVRGERVADESGVTVDPGYGEFRARDVPEWGARGGNT